MNEFKRHWYAVEVNKPDGTIFIDSIRETEHAAERWAMELCCKFRGGYSTSVRAVIVRYAEEQSVLTETTPSSDDATTQK